MNKKAVSNVVGFILIFTVSVSIASVTIVALNALTEKKQLQIGREMATDIANMVADAVVDVVTASRALVNTNYTKIIKLPTDKLAGSEYYIEITDSFVYVNTTDGRISVSSTLFNSGGYGIIFSGRVYSGQKYISVNFNHTSPVYKFDFGTPSSFELGNVSGSTTDYSPCEVGYIRISNTTLMKGGNTGGWPRINGGLYDGTFFSYMTPIVIYNTSPNSTNLSKYPLRIILPSWFPYSAVDKTDEGDPIVIFWEPSSETVNFL